MSVSIFTSGFEATTVTLARSKSFHIESFFSTSLCAKLSSEQTSRVLININDFCFIFFPFLILFKFMRLSFVDWRCKDKVFS
ncbi:Uncharacterised protein [Segatella copri]|nr:Uncharacterised protein [Segatella copri]